MKERPYTAVNGWLALFMIGAGVAGVIAISRADVAAGALIVTMLAAALFTALFGFIAIQPNQARVLLLFGSYRGSVRRSGFFWVLPFLTKKRVSLRVRNFETGSTVSSGKLDAQGKVLESPHRGPGRPSKVNDREGNPISISAVVVWRVVNTVEVCEQLKSDIQDRLQQAGVSVIEARISHLAYSPEIAAAMLQRQQAHAVVAARTQIVEGAVGMVRMALNQLASESIVELDDERRASMVSNLLVVLCSDRHTQPVINTGTLYP
ncbi:MAG: SPFH domain-containing protein [Myxococcota bacterium]